MSVTGNNKVAQASRLRDERVGAGGENLFETQARRLRYIFCL
jgi:hypothetical protein